jgi:hypothetical protein
MDGYNYVYLLPIYTKLKTNDSFVLTEQNELKQKYRKQLYLYEDVMNTGVYEAYPIMVELANVTANAPSLKDYIEANGDFNLTKNTLSLRTTALEHQLCQMYAYASFRLSHEQRRLLLRRCTELFEPDETFGRFQYWTNRRLQRTDNDNNLYIKHVVQTFDGLSDAIVHYRDLFVHRYEYQLNEQVTVINLGNRSALDAGYISLAYDDAHVRYRMFVHRHRIKMREHYHAFVHEDGRLFVFQLQHVYNRCTPTVWLMWNSGFRVLPDGKSAQYVDPETNLVYSMLLKRNYMEGEPTSIAFENVALNVNNLPPNVYARICRQLNEWDFAKYTSTPQHIVSETGNFKIFLGRVNE